MAQTSYSYNSVFLHGAYWRAEISWRTSSGDPHHFIDEWTGTIPSQPADEFTYYTVPNFKGDGTDTDDLQTVGDAKFQFMPDSNITACLDSGNSTAEIRVWYSADNTVWHPQFWGRIDLTDVHRSRLQKVGGSYVKLYEFIAYDSLKLLEEAEFGLYGRMDTTGYKVTGMTVMHANDDLATLRVIKDGVLDYLIPKNLSSGNPELISVLFYFEQLAYYCFDEQYYQSPAVPLAYFGLSGTIQSPYSFIAHEDDTGLPVTLEKQFRDVYLWWDVFAAEWQNDFESWAEFLVEFAGQFGFSISTRHSTTGSPAKWVRSLQYKRVDGQNGVTLTPAGGLVESEENATTRSGRRVVVTTRFPSGGHKVNDVVSGYGKNHNMDTHFHTIGGQLFYSRHEMTGHEKTNVMWHTMVIHDTGTTYRTVQQVKVTVPGPSGGTIAFPDLDGYEMWVEAVLLNYNGVALAMAEFNAAILGPRRLTITETYSKPEVDNGTTSIPGNWTAFALMGDDEYTTEDFKVIDFDINPDNGTVKVTKELIL